MLCPSQINTREQFLDLFGRAETEIAARVLVVFLQTSGRDTWENFTDDDLVLFFQGISSSILDDRCFIDGMKDLLSRRYLIAGTGIYQFSKEFVDKMQQLCDREKLAGHR